MAENELYPMIQNFLEKAGYYPVRIAPTISIRGYRPDVTGIKGKRVVTVEAKAGFDEKSLMEAVTQAQVYSMGSTHAFVAFPLAEWNKGDIKLQSLCTDLCMREGIGIYIVDRSNESVKLELDASLSKYIELDTYEDTVEQLEGEKQIRLYNTYPEYVRDVCIFISNHQKAVSRDELIKKLKDRFDIQYWLGRKGARSISNEAAAENRISSAIDGALELGLLQQLSFQQESTDEIIGLTRTGNLLVNLANELTDDKQPTPLSEGARIFFSTYLMQFPVFSMALDILEAEQQEMILGQSFCEKCSQSFEDVKMLKQGTKHLKCPKCGENVMICLRHRLQLEYGDKEYYHPLKFAKTLGDTPLFLFEFGKISRLDSINIGIQHRQNTGLEPQK